MKAASVTTILGLILISGALLAATTPIGSGDSSSRAAFERLDQDRDQRISRREAAANAGLATHFAKFDRDSDDTLSYQEFLRHERPEQVRASEDAASDDKS